MVLPALPVHHAPVFNGTWPFRPLITTLASWWDDQKQALADATARLTTAPHAAARAGAPPDGKICFVRNATNDGWWSGRRYWASDGIHPNDEGYRVWGEHIGSSILKEALLPAAAPAAGVLAGAATPAAEQLVTELPRAASLARRVAR